ncbi:hypothetical protein P7C70_g4624, partial [Phenoliferia sp. Uapishka_3]
MSSSSTAPAPANPELVVSRIPSDLPRRAATDISARLAPPLPSSQSPSLAEASSRSAVVLFVLFALLRFLLLIYSLKHTPQTAIALSPTQTFLLASHPLDPETLTTLESLPPIAYIAAFDKEHTMSLEQYHKAFPEAKVFVGKNWCGGVGGAVEYVEGRDVVAEATEGEIRSEAFGKSHANEVG